MQNENKAASKEILRGILYLFKLFMKQTTQVYDGIVVSAGTNNTWNIQYNNETHSVKSYGSGVPTINMMVKVVVPQGNQSKAWFFIPGSSSAGGDGTTFIPSVSSEGVISWTNDGGLPNPDPVNIKGPQGNQGIQGIQGIQGVPGPAGNDGQDATINGYSTVTITGSGGIQITQSDGTLTIDGSSISGSTIPYNTVYNGTLSTNWVTMTGGYYNQIAIPNMTTTQNPLIIPQWSSTNKDEEKTQWDTLDATVETFAGYIRFFASSPTTVPIDFALYYQT